MGTPQTPAKGWPPFAIPLEKPYLRTYGLPSLHPAFYSKGWRPILIYSTEKGSALPPHASWQGVLRDCSYETE
ncbi:hypothetical protein KDI_31440 [Dictyobacter arantiisoli]|uniref:Uncharacterized protein n=1 Tax=Dictyobacter arantiisoli TaxID=2014874 RepID=A0A5A5TDG7_9CHLR|nr:hypothetical protein KDI_31440 [Dictyobacter arantiisoli]